MDDRGPVARRVFRSPPERRARPPGSRRLAGSRVGGPGAAERIDRPPVPLDLEVQMRKLRPAGASRTPQQVPGRDPRAPAHRDAAALEVAVLGRPAAAVVEADAVAAFPCPPGPGRGPASGCPPSRRAVPERCPRPRRRRAAGRPDRRGRCPSPCVPHRSGARSGSRGRRGRTGGPYRRRTSSPGRSRTAPESAAPAGPTPARPRRRARCRPRPPSGRGSRIQTCPQSVRVRPSSPRRRRRSRITAAGSGCTGTRAVRSLAHEGRSSRLACGLRFAFPC